MSNHIDIVFDGPPGPVSGRFVEVEDATGKSISFGEWVEREDGYWALRFVPTDAGESEMLNCNSDVNKLYDRFVRDGDEQKFNSAKHEDDMRQAIASDVNERAQKFLDGEGQ